MPKPIATAHQQALEQLDRVVVAHDAEGEHVDGAHFLGAHPSPPVPSHPRAQSPRPPPVRARRLGDPRLVRLVQVGRRHQEARLDVLLGCVRFIRLSRGLSGLSRGLSGLSRGLSR
eukprot:118095-Prorocentrum_minimum.AAC.1